MWDDGNSLGPKEIHSYLTRVMYNRRNKFDPLWNSLVLGGVKKGPKGDEKYLGMVCMICFQMHTIVFTGLCLSTSYAKLLTGSG